MSKTTNVLFAAIGGFVAGILLAPKSGQETRDEIKQKSRDAKEAARIKAAEARAAAKEGVSTLRHGADAAGKEVAEFGKSARTTAEKIAAEAAELGGEARTRASRVANDAKATSHTIQKDAEKRLK